MNEKPKLIMLGSLIVFVLGLCIYTEVFAAPKKATPSPAEDSASARNSVGTYLSKGDKDNAIKKLKEIVSSDKYSDIKKWATMELYNTARSTNQIPQVIADLEKAAVSNPDNLGLKATIAEGYVNLGDWTKVAQVYEEMQQKKPDDFVISTRLNDYYILSGQAEKAIANLEPIVNANPDDKYHSDILANAYVRAGMKDKAIALYKRKVDKNPNSPGLRGTYAIALFDLGMLKESLAEFQQAYALDPTNPFFSQRINQISAQLGVAPKFPKKR